jgi:hypothetical protein
MTPRDTKRARGRASLGAAAVCVAVLSSGCLAGPLSEGNAAHPHLDTKVYPISCEQGRRYAAETLKARNYRITGVSREGSQTVVSGETEKVSSSITVECQAGGVTAHASGGGRWVTDGLRFGFYQLAEAGDRIWPPPTGPVVKMDLWKGPEAKIEFPVELEPLGLIAVQVLVINAGDRVLRIDPRRIHVEGENGAPVAPLSAAEAERKLGGVDPELKSKLLQPTQLKPGDKTVGFVFFPTGAYTSGSLALIDQKTGEADDYAVNFPGS